MATRASVVIVGAGIVGCAAAKYLSDLGWTDLVVVGLPDRPATLGLALVAAGIGVVVGARTRQVFAVTLALVWFFALAWAWSR